MAAVAAIWPTRPETVPDCASSLPNIGTNKLTTATKDSSYRTGSVYTSLPPLPKYVHSVNPNKRWGEDEYIEKLGFQATSSGYGRLRYNVDCCHPVPDITAAKYEGYMFPKPMHQDLSVLRMSATSTVRHVPRESGCELFPTNDSQRKALNGQYVLGEASRSALARYVKHLYRTSGNGAQFKDTSEFMKRRMDRETQFKSENQKFNPVPTCSRILNHVDPCPLCWNGEFHDQFEDNLVYAHSRLCDCPQRSTDGCMLDRAAGKGDINSVYRWKKITQDEVNMKGAACQGSVVTEDVNQEKDKATTGKDIQLKKGADSRFKSTQCSEGAIPISNNGPKAHGIAQLPSSAGGAACEPKEMQINASGDCKRGDKQSATAPKMTEESESNLNTCAHKSIGVTNLQTHPPASGNHASDGRQNSELFGPWGESFHLPEVEEDSLMPYVYRYKFPSSFHFLPTENDFVSNSQDRHTANPKSYVKNGQYYGPWTAMSRINGTLTVIPTQVKKPDENQDKREPLPPVLYPGNRWTYRDKDDLRIPCIAHVIGSTHKTDAHKRFHMEHPEATPDLRDFRRSSKRVTFYGYNSSIFR